MMADMARWLPLALILAMTLLACEATATPSSEPSAATASLSDAVEPSASAAPASTPPPPAEHRIGIRVVDGRAEFFDRLTDERWVPRGFNHWRWTFTGGYLMDATFRAGENALEDAKA